MNQKFQFIFSALLIVISVNSCKPKEIETEISAGEIDPGSYVAIGGSITAGFMDDALYSDGQQNSLGAIISTQFALVGGGGFNQPLMPNTSVGCNASGLSKLILGYKTDCLGVTSLSPIRKALLGDNFNLNTNIYSSTSLFNNFGIPSLKVTEYNQVGIGNPANGAGNYNPFFARMASNQVTTTVKGDIASKNPTFFTLFAGLDEVVDFAKGGAAAGVLIDEVGPVGIGFSGSIEDLLELLTSNGAKGVISNIPDVTEFPYFTTIPYDGLDLDQEGADALNQIYNPIGIFFEVGKNAFVIEDPDAGAFGVRKMVPGEKITLGVPLDSVKCFKMGSVFPFRNEFILTIDEQNEIRSKINAYNVVIEQLAIDYNLAFVDSYSFFSNLSTGIVYNGISMSSKFVSGGAYSLDGITLNPRGNAMLANLFIAAINVKYYAKIPHADVTKYRGVIFP